MPIYEKKAEKLRVRKTPAAKRTTYTYPIYDGSTITLIPGKDGITEEFIVLLHHLDDAEVRNNLKNGRPELTAEEKQAVKEWENAHPGEKAPRNWNLSIDYVMSDDEHDSEKAAIENIPDGNVKETAAILGMSSPTVTAHKKRIVEIIKKFFEEANFSG